MATATRATARRPSQRLRRLGWVAAGVLAVLFLLFLGLRSEAFWRAVVFPRYFGPYWFTALRWDSFTPTVFPPGLHFRNIELKEPGRLGRTVASATELHVVTSWWSDSEKVVVPRLVIIGGDFNLEVKPDGQTNLDGALARLFQGRPPDPAAARAGATPELPFVMPSLEFGTVVIREPSVRYADFRKPGDPTIVRFRVQDNVTLTGRGFGREVGSIDEFLVAVASGDLAARVGGVIYQGSVDLRLNVDDLKKWPRGATMEARAVLVGVGPDRPTINLSALVPLNRLSVRPNATPFDQINAQLTLGDDKRQLASIRDARFDPLRGDFAGTFEANAGGAELTQFLASFATEGTRPDLLEAIEESPAGSLLSATSRSTLRLRATVEGSGLFQYAIVDAEENLPYRLVVDTEGTLGAARPDELAERLAGFDLGPFGQVALRDPLDVTGKLKVTLDEQADKGTLWGELAFEPARGLPPTIGMSITLSDRTDPTKPIEFRITPVQPPAPPASAERAGDQPLLFPSYETVLAVVNEQLAATTGRLDAHGVQEARLRLRLETTSRRILGTALTPVFSGFESARRLELSLMLDRVAPDRPTEWRGGFELDGISIEGLSTETALLGNVALEQNRNLVRARELSLDLVKTARDDARQTTFTLALRPLVPGGELPETWLDLSTGEGAVELQLDQLNREIVEVLMRLQTFGLSERLAAPFYRRILDVLGFRPDDPTARTKAVIAMTARFGRELDISSELRASDISAANFFVLAPEQAIEAERFDAVFHQAMSLDRATGLLSPREVRLSLQPPGRHEPFVELLMKAEERCQLSYATLLGLADMELQALATDGPMTPMAALRGTLRAFFGRIERLRGALLEGRATVTLSVPQLDLAEFRRAAEAAGFPVEAGIFRMLLTCQISTQDVASDVADGGFSLEGVRLAGMTDPLPAAQGILSITRSGPVVQVRRLSTSLFFDPSRPPTSIDFEGEVRTDTIDSTWTLALRDVNGAAVGALSRLRTAAIGESAAVISSLPLASLAEASGTRGRVDLTLDGRSVAQDRTVHLSAYQHGEELVFLPSVFSPITFDLYQGVRLLDEGTVELTALRGQVVEKGNPAPLATLSIDRPITLLNPSQMDEATSTILTLAIRKDLDPGHPLLGGYKVPLLDRALVGGRLSGELKSLVQLHSLDRTDARHRTQSRFTVAVSELGMEGFEPRLAGRLEGRLESNGPVIELSDTRLDASLGDEPIGAIDFAAEYDGSRDWLRSRVEATRLQPRVLGALPVALSEWTRLANSEANILGTWEGTLRSGRADVGLELRARNIMLPPLAMPDGSAYQHPELHFDGGFVATVDRTTTSVLLKQLDLHLLSAPAQVQVDPFDRVTSWTTSVARMRTTAPVAYRWDVPSFLPTTIEGAGVEGTFGPFAASEYRPILQRYLGLPLSEGQLSGRWSANAVGIEAMRRAELETSWSLDNGAWAPAEGPPRPINAQLNARGSSRPGVIRVEDLVLRFAHPGMGPDEVDDLRLMGSLNYQERPRIDATLSSTGMQLDRLMALYEDLQLPEADPGVSSMQAEPLGFVDDIDGQLAVSLSDVRFREILFSRLSGKATLDRGLLTLQNANGLLSAGAIEMSGRALLRSNAASPWSLSTTMRDVEVSPFLKSFVAETYANMVAGKLSTQIDLSGVGFTTEGFRQTRGGGEARLTAGRVVGPRLEGVFGESAIEANSRFMLRDNRLLFDLKTPWNPSRDLQLSGTLRNLVAGPGEFPWLTLLGRFTRTTTVGPRGRTVEQGDGTTVPFRQSLVAVTLEVDGPLEPGEFPRYRVRTIDY